MLYSCVFHFGPKKKKMNVSWWKKKVHVQNIIISMCNIEDHLLTYDHGDGGGGGGGGGDWWWWSLAVIVNDHIVFIVVVAVAVVEWPFEEKKNIKS